MGAIKNFALRAVIQGRVQGVYYRAWTQAQAQALGLTGWVRNLQDGSVELRAEGPKEKLEELLRRCQVGPPAAEVKQINSQWQEAEAAWSDFSIQY